MANSKLVEILIQWEDGDVDVVLASEDNAPLWEIGSTWVSDERKYTVLAHRPA